MVLVEHLFMFGQLCLVPALLYAQTTLIPPEKVCVLAWMREWSAYAIHGDVWLGLDIYIIYIYIYIYICIDSIYIVLVMT